MVDRWLRTSLGLDLKPNHDYLGAIDDCCPSNLSRGRWNGKSKWNLFDPTITHNGSTWFSQTLIDLLYTWELVSMSTGTGRGHSAVLERGTG